MRDSFGDGSFLNGNDLHTSSEKLARILSDPSALRKLKIELVLQLTQWNLSFVPHTIWKVMVYYFW